MATTEENLALIQKVTLNWVHGNYQDILPYVAEDAVYEIARGTIEKFSTLFGTFRGKAEITRWYEANSQEAASPTGIRPFCLIGDLGTFIGAGDKVINYGTMSKTPTEPACDWVAIWTLDGGMIKNCWEVMDTATTFLKLKKYNPKLVLE
jgi:hypothetical protein